MVGLAKKAAARGAQAAEDTSHLSAGSCVLTPVLYVLMACAASNLRLPVRPAVSVAVLGRTEILIGRVEYVEMTWQELVRFISALKCAGRNHACGPSVLCLCRVRVVGSWGEKPRAVNL